MIKKYWRNGFLEILFSNYNYVEKSQQLNAGYLS